MQGRYTELVLIALCLALPLRVAAAEDGPLLCVPIEEVECGHTGDCQSNVYESMNSISAAASSVPAASPTRPIGGSSLNH